MVRLTGILGLSDFAKIKQRLNPSPALLPPAPSLSRRQHMLSVPHRHPRIFPPSASNPSAQIEYLKAENQVLRSRLGRRRLLFSDAERRTLATLAKAIGAKRCETSIRSSPRRHYYAGIGNSLRRNRRFWSGADRAVSAIIRDSRTNWSWRSAFQERTPSASIADLALAGC
jgi:hypothetical protein